MCRRGQITYLPAARSSTFINATSCSSGGAVARIASNSISQPSRCERIREYSTGALPKSGSGSAATTSGAAPASGQPSPGGAATSRIRPAAAPTVRRHRSAGRGAGGRHRFHRRRVRRAAGPGQRRTQRRRTTGHRRRIGAQTAHAVSGWRHAQRAPGTVCRATSAGAPRRPGGSQRRAVRRRHNGRGHWRRGGSTGRAPRRRRARVSTGGRVDQAGVYQVAQRAGLVAAVDVLRPGPAHRLPIGPPRSRARCRGRRRRRARPAIRANRSAIRRRRSVADPRAGAGPRRAAGPRSRRRSLAGVRRVGGHVRRPQGTSGACGSRSAPARRSRTAPRITSAALTPSAIASASMSAVLRASVMATVNNVQGVAAPVGAPRRAHVVQHRSSNKHGTGAARNVNRLLSGLRAVCAVNFLENFSGHRLAITYDVPCRKPRPGRVPRRRLARAWHVRWLPCLTRPETYGMPLHATRR